MNLLLNMITISFSNTQFSNFLINWPLGEGIVTNDNIIIGLQLSPLIHDMPIDSAFFQTPYVSLEPSSKILFPT